MEYHIYLKEGLLSMKMIKRLFAFALVCMLFASMAVPASAAEWDPASDLMPIEWENGPEAGSVTGARAEFPFTMKASWVTTLLATKNYNKYFVPKEHAGFGATVWADGNFTHSEGKYMKAGICYFDESNQIYVPADEAVGRIYHDTDFAFYEDLSSLQQSIRYYGYVKNEAGTGAVNGGSMDVYVAYG